MEKKGEDEEEEVSEIHNNKHQKSGNGSKFEGLNDSHQCEQADREHQNE